MWRRKDFRFYANNHVTSHYCTVALVVFIVFTLVFGKAVHAGNSYFYSFVGDH